MNKKNWLIIGVVVLVALGVWFYFDSREDVGLGPGGCGPPHCFCTGKNCDWEGGPITCYNWNGDVCEESGGITDSNDDGYDDVSYDAGAESVDVGDMNDDGENNVQDVILLVNDILTP